MSGGQIEKFGVQTSKGIVITAFRNGDKHHTGERLVIHPTKQKKFSQVLDLMTQKVKVSTGSVRRVFHITGKEIKELNEFKDGEKYICCGSEKVKKDLLPPSVLAEIEKLKAEKKKVPENNDNNNNDNEVPVEAIEEKSEKKNEKEEDENEEENIEENEEEEKNEEINNNNNSNNNNNNNNEENEKIEIKEVKKEEKKIEKFGTQTNKAKVVKIFRNGDKHHTGDLFSIHQKKYKTLEQLFIDITQKVGISTGNVRKLVRLSKDGKKMNISSFEQIKDGQSLVACGAEPLKVDLVNKAYFEGKEEKSTVKKAALDNNANSPAKTSTKSIQKFGTQIDKGKVIFVFRNGDKHDEGTRLVIHEKKFKNISQVHEQMSQKVGIYTGSVRKVFTPTGTLVNAISDFEDGGEYICSGGEELKKDLFSLALIERIEKKDTKIEII